MTEIAEEKKDDQKPSKDYDVPQISRFEFLIYLIIWLAIVGSGCYELYKLGYNKKTRKYFSKQGFITDTYFGLYRATHEYLWTETSELFFKYWSYFALYILLSKVLRSKTTPETFMIGCTIIAITFNYKFSSLKFVGMEVAILVVLGLAGLIRNKILVWIFGIAMLYYLKYFPDYSFFKTTYIFSHSYPYTALLITRGISVGVTIANAQKCTIKLFMEMIYYYWYFPAIIGCRMMTVGEFVAQIYKPYVIQNWKSWIYGVIRVFIYFLCWDILTNLFHVYLITYTHDVRYIHIIHILGSQMFYGLHFYMVYVVLYKTIYLLTQLDGYLTTDGPECVAHIALYSRMWRNFDRGLHEWIKDHIFRPIVKLGKFDVTKHIAAFASFGFVVCFHGLEVNNLLWISINIFQYYAEHFIKHTYRCTKLGAFMENMFSPIWLRRIIGFVGGLSFLISIYAFAAFQYNIQMANDMYLSAFKHERNKLYHRLLWILLFVYVHSQISLTTNEFLRKRKLKTS